MLLRHPLLHVAKSIWQVFCPARVALFLRLYGTFHVLRMSILFYVPNKLFTKGLNFNTIRNNTSYVLLVES